MLITSECLLIIIPDILVATKLYESDIGGVRIGNLWVFWQNAFREIKERNKK